MLRFISVGGLVCLLLSACTSSSSDSDIEPDIAIGEHDLVGGGETRHRPEVGFLEAEGKKCTATLVARNVVVTAAGCVAYKTGALADGASFRIDASDKRAATYRAVEAKSFGDGSVSKTDIALVRVADTVLSALAKPVRLSARPPGNGELVASYGYGCTDRATRRLRAA